MRFLTARLRHFLRSERGSFTAECVVIFPLLVWAYTAMFVFWDAYKTQNINLKATYTIADMISREERVICDPYIAGANSIYAYLSNGNTNHRMRVTFVIQIPDPGGGPSTLQFGQFVEPAGTMAPYTDVSQFESIVPAMADFDMAIIVTTATDWDPPFRTVFAGLPPMTLTETVVTSPRFGGVTACPPPLAVAGGT